MPLSFSGDPSPAQFANFLHYLQEERGNDNTKIFWQAKRGWKAHSIHSPSAMPATWLTLCLQNFSACVQFPSQICNASCVSTLSTNIAPSTSHVPIPALRATPTIHKSVKLRGTPRQFMYANWDPTIQQLEAISTTLVFSYIIFYFSLSSQGVVFRPLFFEYKLLIPYTHPFVWTRFTSPLSALSSSILCSVCIGTAELHVTLELLSILQTENIGAPTPQMQYFVIVSQWVWSSSPGAKICCGQRIMLQW